MTANKKKSEVHVSIYFKLNFKIKFQKDIN